MRCMNCGMENPKNAIFCGKCGQFLDRKKPLEEKRRRIETLCQELEEIQKQNESLIPGMEQEEKFLQENIRKLEQKKQILINSLME